MTSRYILDENVVIYAQRALDQYNNPNFDCANLVGSIIDDDFRVLVMDNVLWDKYDDQLNHPAYYHTQDGAYLIIRLWDRANAF